MTNKKIRLPLFLAASFLLVGCSSDTIVARPHGWGDEKIFVEAGDKDNRMKSIYDAIKNLGDTNSTVLSNIMYNIAKTHIGKFVKDSATDTDLTLSDIIANDKKDPSNYYKSDEFKSFVDNHSKYKSEDFSAQYNSSTKQVEKVAIEGDDKYLVSLNKIKNQYNEIMENIFEKLFEEIKGGSYSEGDSKLFNEESFYQHLNKELYFPTKPDHFVSNKAFLPMGKITGDTPWKDYVNAIYNGSTFETGYLQVVDSTGKFTGIYDNYIKEKILPELYKTYLAQTYVSEQRSSSLGRSYARKVNMVTIPMGTEQGKIVTMANYFAKTYITGATIGSRDANYNFELLNEAMSGFVGTDADKDVYKLLTHNAEQETPTTSNFSILNIPNTTTTMVWRCYTDKNGKPKYNETTNLPEGELTHVFKGTKLGDLVEKYNLLFDFTPTTTTDDRNFTVVEKQKLSTEAISAYNDITNNGEYSLAVGMAIKEKEARLTDMTKEGWFLKNGGLTDLDSKFRDNLFNIKTSTNIDDKEKIENLSKYESGDYVRYLGASAGQLTDRKAFLATGTTSDTKPWQSIVLIGSSNVYIVEVEEAANTSKLSKADNKASYYFHKAQKYTDLNHVQIANEVDKLNYEIVKANSSNDTYKKNANEYYLMISNIVFYDQSVYDYFKSQFPDLFK